jgi:hypothetical protein
MEKEFLNYKQSIALKELGFDESCLAVYNCYNELNITQNIFNGETYAPLIQQAFRFFRDKYGLLSYLSPGGDDKWFCNIEEGDDLVFLLLYNTYEEAEQACLNKLIELVEEK